MNPVILLMSAHELISTVLYSAALTVNPHKCTLMTYREGIHEEVKQLDQDQMTGLEHRQPIPKAQDVYMSSLWKRQLVIPSFKERNKPNPHKASSGAFLASET